jgi:dGTPase
LGLNEDLAEAVALAHDLGHTPFGHSGEDVLDELTAEHGGFNHNRQSLRVVDFLEKRYPDHFGLNLTYELREAIIKHETAHQFDIPDEFESSEKPLLEGQVVDLADEIAYDGHDVDDGLSSGLLTLDQLRETDIFKNAFPEIESNLAEKSPDMIRSALVRYLVNRMVLDLGEETARRLKQNNIGSVEDVRNSDARLVAFSEKQEAFNLKLKRFLQGNMYSHPDLHEMRRRSAEIISFLFGYYMDHIDAIPGKFRNRYPDQEPHILVSDYIAGMTDRFARNEFSQLK